MSKMQQRGTKWSYLCDFIYEETRKSEMERWSSLVARCARRDDDGEARASGDFFPLMMILSETLLLLLVVFVDDDNCSETLLPLSSLFEFE